MLTESLQVQAGSPTLSTVALISIVLLLVGIIWLYARPSRSRPTCSNNAVQILLLGDIGHSPRMQNHALSIAKKGGRVTLIGYEGCYPRRLESEPQSELSQHPLIDIVAISHPPKFLRTLQNQFKQLFPLLAAFKVAHQFCSLLFAMMYSPVPPKWLLVQNPPCIPTFVIAVMVCLARNSSLIIDWHNFGYSILAMKMGESHPLVRLLKLYEVSFGHFASFHFCVSEAMARVLKDQIKLRTPVHVLYDRPPAIFQPVDRSSQERWEFLTSVPETAQFVKQLMHDRSALLVSSTSWTPDEDFGVLIDALLKYSALASTTREDLPFLGVIITGKGPSRRVYRTQLAALSDQGRLDKVTVKCTWLSFQDYARLLGCATLGISLHTSSSGVDLPMKVVDMFGAGLPVLGWNQYPAWRELVTEEKDGLGFSSSDELFNHLIRLLGGNREYLKKLRQGALEQSHWRWDAEWNRVAGPLLGLVR